MSTLDNPQISSEKAQDRQIEKRGTGKDDSPNESGSSTAPTLDEIIPEGAATNSNDVPTFAGLCGSKLLYAITFVASAGFGLFGYVCFFPPPVLSLVANRLSRPTDSLSRRLV